MTPSSPRDIPTPPEERAEPTPNESSRSSPPGSDSSDGSQETTCANCDAPLDGTYCGVCGQRAADRIVPLWQVTNEFLEDLFDLDLRILRTFPTFFFWPGRLTNEYLRGRRRRYIRPLRLYLFSSFLLFTVLALTNLNGFSFSFGSSTEEAQAEVEGARAELQAVRAELARQFNPQSPSPNDPSAAGARPDSSHRQTVAASVDYGMKSVEEALAALGPAMAAREQGAPAVPPPTLVDVVEEMTEGQVALQPKLMGLLHDPGKLVDDLIDRAPYLMFLLVPTFALLLKGLYLRRKRLYLEHLIFALHVHALAFIAFAMSAGVGALNWGSSLHLDWWMALAPFGYLFVALRRVYGQSPGVTALKAGVLLFAYGIILVGGVVLLVIGSVALM